MKTSFKLYLFMVMIIFALVISITLAIFNYIVIKNQAIENENRIIEEKTNLLLYALDTSEKANVMLGDNIAQKMYNNTLELLTLYEETPLEQWDYELLSQEMNMDIFIINNENEIIHSNIFDEIGLNFNNCCRKLATKLDERRATHEFFHDGLDVEQASGKIKKYSYMSTSDHNYIIQLGFSWEKDFTFQQFSFIEMINNLISSSIIDIHVLNNGGIPLGFQEHSTELTKERRDAFNHTLSTGETTRKSGTWYDKDVTFIYVQYVSAYDTSFTQKKVIEIIYNEEALNMQLAENKQSFMFQIIIIIVVTIILAIIISRQVAKPIYLAFHDSLTQVGNRAHIEEYLAFILKKKINAAIIVVDMDHFKQVNDTLGHDVGDALLQQTAKLMKTITKDVKHVFRLGGDEFMIVLPNVTESEAIQKSTTLIQLFQEKIASNYELDKPLSLSVGITFTPANDVKINIQELSKQADEALYQSKKLGKNQCSVYVGRDHTDKKEGIESLL